MRERWVWLVLAGVLTGYLTAAWVDERAERASVPPALRAGGMGR